MTTNETNKKRVLFVVDNLNYGGVEKSLVLLIENLKGKNYDIDIIPLSANGAYFEELKEKGCNIIPLPRTKYDRELLLNSFRKKVESYVKGFKLKKLFSLIYLYVLGTVNKLTRELSISEKIRCELVNSFADLQKEYDVAISYVDRSYALYTLKKVNAKKRIMWVHSDYDAMANDVVGYNKIYSFFNRFVCVSNRAASSFIKRFPSIGRDKIEVINDLLDINKMDKASAYKFNENTFNIVSVGRLSPEKGFGLLIDIFFAVSKLVDDKQINLHLIGDGPNRNEIEHKITKYGLDSQIYLHGYKNDPYPFIKGADLYVQPSLMEGYCISIYEALYLRKYTIVFNVADVSELITNGINGDVCFSQEEMIEKIVDAIRMDDHKLSNSTISSDYNSLMIEKIKTLLDD